jgi:hypothetical protein
MIDIKAIESRLTESPWSELCLPMDSALIGNSGSYIQNIPKLHRQILERYNGFSLYYGYFKLFGIGGKRRDMIDWNNPDKWKYAWHGIDLDKYLCFAEDLWGFQWAYSIPELYDAKITPRIYWLQAFTMISEPFFESFEEFMQRLVYRWASETMGDDIISVYKKNGPLSWSEQIAYIPSLLLGTHHEDFKHTKPMDAVRNMVFNGDLFTQIGNIRVDDPVLGVEVYQDEKGRDRLKAILPKNKGNGRVIRKIGK